MQTEAKEQCKAIQGSDFADDYSTSAAGDKPRGVPIPNKRRKFFGGIRLRQRGKAVVEDMEKNLSAITLRNDLEDLEEKVCFSKCT